VEEHGVREGLTDGSADEDDEVVTSVTEDHGLVEHQELH
jgi:hypothetical protein